MGDNASVSALRALCPNRDYRGCFGQAMLRRYPSVDLFDPRLEGKRSRSGAAAQARRHFPNCAGTDGREGSATPVRELAEEDGPGESFASAALSGSDVLLPAYHSGVDTGELRRRMRVASVQATLRVSSAASAATELSANGTRGDASPRPPPAALSSSSSSSSPPPSRTAAATPGPLRCASPARALDGRLLVLIGLPTTAHDLRRREAARVSWMQHATYGRAVGACFLLSAHVESAEREALVREHAVHGDLLLLDVPETRWLLRAPTRYSNYSKLGRGMPTFKQFEFFRHAARLLKRVPYVAKIDDDTAPNLGQLVPTLHQLRCRPHTLLGAINWAAVVPNAHDTGVRNDRCGFGWGMRDALHNYGTTFGSPTCAPERMRGWRRCPGYFPACDGLGAVPPFPYGTGAGYVFSAAVLRWVASDAGVLQWVRDAAGPSREALQWQKFEDTSTGYWLTYAPFTIDYLNIGRWVRAAAACRAVCAARDWDRVFKCAVPPWVRCCRMCAVARAHAAVCACRARVRLDSLLCLCASARPRGSLPHACGPSALMWAGHHACGPSALMCVGHLPSCVWAIMCVGHLPSCVWAICDCRCTTWHATLRVCGRRWAVDSTARHTKPPCSSITSSTAASATQPR